MYEQFFGLEDEPFRLTPDPRYLFLSPKHAEALAHLRLGLSESSGFVCITGEVGTGKTTLLRVFLSELGPNVTAAYTYVPPLSAIELLRRVCREFHLPAAGHTQSELVDELHAYLIAQHQAGRICVVVLDEAQALSIELLEQIRLLLNLETETHKLLRIILVGQPQLRKLLLDPELAQLNQRITLRWHLGPLSYRETAAYVSHRLTVASGGRATHLFTKPALRLLHSVSFGVPRLVNMVAHRALLAAFVARQTRVNRRVLMQAYREIQAVPLPGTLSSARKTAWAVGGLAIGIALVGFGGPLFDRFFNTPLPPAAPASLLVRANPEREALPAQPPAPPPAPVQEPPTPPAIVAAAPAVAEAAAPNPAAPEPARPDPPTAAPAAPVAAAPALAPHPPEPAAPAAAAPTPAAEVPPGPAAPLAVASVPESPNAVRLSSADELVRRLGSLDRQGSIRTSAQTLLSAWGEHTHAAAPSDTANEIESLAWRYGLQDLALTSNRSMLRLLDLPALIALRPPGTSEPRYVALIEMDTARTVVSIDGVAATVDNEVLERFWSGQAHVFWRDFDGLGTMLKRGARGVAVVRLQRLLQRVEAYDGDPTGVFDAATEQAVLRFQRRHQLDDDGLVGPLTRIVLYGAVGGYPRPTLAMRTGGRL
jgi:general secretion pathway protein A